MTSPAIGFGDLMVFIAVLILVAAFLMVVHSFIRRVESQSDLDGNKQDGDTSSKEVSPSSPSK
jgi:hypothetical protein